MEKRYVCFICYKFHPEMRGVSEEKFNAGDNICTQPKCTRRGAPLEPAHYCSTCDTVIPWSANHSHTN